MGSNERSTEIKRVDNECDRDLDSEDDSKSHSEFDRVPLATAIELPCPPSPEVFICVVFGKNTRAQNPQLLFEIA